MAPILPCVHLEKHRSGESLRLENQEFEGSLDFGVRILVSKKWEWGGEEIRVQACYKSSMVAQIGDGDLSFVARLEESRGDRLHQEHDG